MKNTSKNISRRGFLKSSALLGGTTVGLSLMGSEAFAALSEDEKKQFIYELQKPENTIYTSCLQCHNACTLKTKIYNGFLAKIDGNPYGPQNMLPNIDYKTDINNAVEVDGKACPKGQAGIQTAYDPYRLKKILKRAGKRGENKWKTIDFNKAVDEVVNGGNLFGEGHVKGFKEIRVLTDPKLAKKMGSDAKKVGKGKMTLKAFQTKYKDNLDVLIDPNHPDLGPKNNKFVMMNGRIEHGRKELSQRFTKSAFGSTNWFEHTSICEQSHHIGFNEVTNKWVVKDGKGKWTGGKHHLKPDFLHSEYAIFFGTGAFEANFGKTSMAQKVTDALVERNFKMAVVDPRMSQTAAKAEDWVPIKPGTDAALAWGMIRWIIENERYDKTFLKNATKGAAKKTGEKTITDASLLVKIIDGRVAKFLRADEVGLGSNTDFVTSINGKLVKANVNDSNKAVIGDLKYTGKVKGFKVKSAFQLVIDEAFSRSLDDWSKICDVKVETIIKLAKKFTSHGKKAVAELYRGAVQHTNGYYNAASIIYLNLLVGNIDWLGGMQVGGGHWHEDGSHHGYFNLKSALHPNKFSAFGIPITREKTKYEDTTLFQKDSYPAKRSFYPFTGSVYQEILPSGMAGYPYNIDCLMIHKGTPLLSVPGGYKMIEYVSDPKKLPLFIASDIVIGETSMYADYIFPDTTYLERWATSHTTPDVAQKTSKIRQPVITPIPEIVEVNGEKMAMNLETFLIAVAQKMNLSGFGKNGFGEGMPLTRQEDWYLKRIANIAKGDHEGDELPPANEQDYATFRAARRHFPKSLFNPERWKQAVGNDETIWRRVVTVLNKGGRFEDYQDAFKSAPHTKSQYKGFAKFFVEHVAEGKNAISGKHFYGIAKYTPIKGANDKEIGFDTLKGNELYMSTFKAVFGGQSRTIGNYWSQLSLKPENVLYINKIDADRLGFKNNEWVTFKSSDNPNGTIDLKNGNVVAVKARLSVIQGIRPGVVTMSWHFGHWAYGGNDVLIDNQLVKGDPRRKDTACPNPLLAIDKTVGNMCLSDVIGGSASFYNSKVELLKA
jgi:anaerobic selenocysteine-containing dehydrogenase